MARTDPTAPPSCPTAEWPGPATSPCPANSSTFSSNARISTIDVNMESSSFGSAAAHAPGSVASDTHGALACRGSRMAAFTGYPVPSSYGADQPCPWRKVNHWIQFRLFCLTMPAEFAPSGIDGIQSEAWMEQGGGLPGLRGVEHVGFTVPDLEEATRF